MFLSAQAFFENKIPDNNRLLIRAETQLPAEWLKRYKKNVVNLTPMKTGALRRSIITRQLGDTAEVSWRIPYAAQQNKGYHTVYERRVIHLGDRFVTLQPGVYRYHNYTTPGTGPNFANIAFRTTNTQMPAVLRELGLTK